MFASRRTRAEAVMSVNGEGILNLRVARFDSVLPRRHDRVDAKANRVANVRRPKKRQDKIRSGTKAPNMEGLAEIARLLGKTNIAGDLKHTAQASGRVHDQTAKSRSGVGELALQQVVRHDDRLAHVLENGSDAILIGGGP